MASGWRIPRPHLTTLRRTTPPRGDLPAYGTPTCYARATFQIWDAPHAEVDSRLFVDGSVVELFIDGINVTTRVYPTERNSTGLRIGALDGTVQVTSVELWSLAAM